MNKKKNILCVFGVLVFLACIVFWNGFMRKSDFSWTVQQDGYWNAVFEMCIAYWIFLMIWCLQFKTNVFRIVLTVGAILVFAFLHSFFYAVIVSALYGLMIYMTGYIINKSIFRKKSLPLGEIHFCFVTGMACLIILVGLASVLKVGTAEKIRVIFSILFVIELLICCKDIKKKIIEAFQKKENNLLGEKQNLKYSAIIALIITMFTLVICRANLGMDYDSLWYGLRSEFVLAPYTGIYDKVTLMGCVYTYSKGIEVLALPFSGLSTYSFILGVNVLFCGMTLWAIYDLGKIAGQKKSCIIMVAFAALTPSIMNLAVTAKSDMATIYLQIVVLIYAVRAIKEKSGEYLAMAFSIVLLSFGFKPSSIVFSSLIIIAILAFAIIYKIKICIKAMINVVVPFLAVAVLWVRTWLLTGYPITSLLVSIFEKLGFYPKYPYTLPSANTMSVKELFTTGAIWERIGRLYRIFFTPDGGDIVTLEITWWGILFSVLWIVAMLLIFIHPIKTLEKIKNDKIYAFQTVLLVMCSAVSIGCMLILTTPDGNYFMLMHVLTYWFIAQESENWEKAVKYKICLIGGPLVACNFLLCIVISSSWMVGVTPINLNNRGYYNHKKLYVEPYMEGNGLSEIYEYLLSEYENGNIRRLIGFSGKEQAMHSLPAIIESCVHQQGWAAETIDTAQHLERFIKYADVDGLLVEKEYISSQENYANILAKLAEDGYLQIEFDTDGFLLVDIGENQKDENTIQYFKNILNSL